MDPDAPYETTLATLSAGRAAAVALSSEVSPTVLSASRSAMWLRFDPARAGARQSPPPGGARARARPRIA